MKNKSKSQLFLKISVSLSQAALTDIMVTDVKKFVGIVKTFHSAIMSMGLAWTVVNLGTERNIANKVWNITYNINITCFMNLHFSINQLLHLILRALYVFLIKIAEILKTAILQEWDYLFITSLMALSFNVWTSLSDILFKFLKHKIECDTRIDLCKIFLSKIILQGIYAGEVFPFANKLVL